ncbi:hypothetical protein B0H14DRAFT_3086172 [Mycena olivaceomarginata]|nr:hypothetical protein B0H14DRAFT_3086172 [Mycena olivaceomarginata]
MMVDTGRHRELPSWRKDFKSEWKRCRHTPITLPFNDRFLLCKHLVQAVHPVDPIFFLEVTRNRSTPFWSHPSLKPLDVAPALSTSPVLPASQPVHRDDIIQEAGDESDEELVEIKASATFDERLTSHLTKIRDFCDGMEYQRQFRDMRMLDALEREGAPCLSRERRANSTRSAAPTTWEKSAASAMFYGTRPKPSERDT